MHRVYEFWRVAEPAVDAWGHAMAGEGTAGVDRNSATRGGGPRHGVDRFTTAEDLRAQGRPAPLADLKHLDKSMHLRQASTSCTLILLLARAGANLKLRTRDGRSALHEVSRSRTGAPTVHPCDEFACCFAS